MKAFAIDYTNLTIKKVVPALLCLLIVCTFIYFSVAANVDLSIGRFALFMDERITFDGVKKILHPDGLIAFINAVAGGDQRYGRSLWASMATFSFIPELIWGDSGQIIAGRMLQVFLILSAWFIFAFGILRNWYLRFVLTVAILSMPYSDYYMSMPKPEPLQLFFLATFCFYYFRNKLKFGWYWIFAGLAFGTKISTLPALVVFCFFALLICHKDNENAHFWRSLRVALLCFFAGLAIAVPILLIPVLLGIGTYYLYMYLNNKLHLSAFSKISVVVFSILITYFVCRKLIKAWVNSTFLDTKNGADQASVNLWSWINYFFENWLIVPEWIGVSFIVVALIFISFYSALLLRSKAISPNSVAALSVALSGIALNIAIFIGAHRLWGFYVYPGTILMVTGLIFMIDFSLSDKANYESALIKKLIAILAHAVALYLVCIATIVWAPHTIKNLKELAQRTKSEEYIQQYASYQEIIKFLDNKASVENRMLRVMLTPSLFPPESNSKYEIVEFWGPYNKWDESPDAIVFGSINTPKGLPTPSDSPSYSSFLLERQGYAKHVAEKGSSCQATPCFERVLLLPNQGEILVLK